MIKNCKISDGKGKKSDFSINILLGLHDFLYKLQLQQGRAEKNVPLLQLMVSVKYLGMTATATGTNLACVSVAVAVMALPFLSHQLQQKQILLLQYRLRLRPDSFGGKSPNLSSKSAKKVIFCQKWQNIFFSSKMPK